jgi:hypothetical protein
MPGNNEEKEQTMKRIITLAIFIVGVSLAMTNRISAQNSSVTVQVPFDFAVGDHVLPKGTYKIQPDGDFLLFNSKEHSASSFFANAWHGDASIDGRSVLSFDVVDGQHFLRKIAATSSTTSADFPVSKLEKNATELYASHQTASSLNRGR